MPEHSPTILILGGGFAGAYCAQELERRLGPAAASVVLVDRQNYFIFHPLLIEAGTGSLEPRHAVVPIRSFIRRGRFIMGEAVGVDWTTRQAEVLPAEATEPIRVPFDHLVIALGSVTRLPEVPGLRQHGLEMKSLADAVGLRDRAIRMLEAAESAPHPERKCSLLHFVVVGANFTGAEVAGELEAFLRAAIRRYRTIRPHDLRVTLVERSARILGALDEDLSRYAERKMRDRGIDVRLNDSVTRIEPHRVTLASGEALNAETVVWAAGIAPPPMLAHLGLPLDARGYLVCDRDLRVQGRPNVWGIGDAAVNTDAAGVAYPATAQHAIREGVHAARNIAAAFRGQPTTPCDIVSQGSLAALGCRTGVANVFGIRLSGFAAWWLWRTVYLLKMPGLGRKLRVAIDWTLELLFRRDYVQLGVHQPQRRG